MDRFNRFVRRFLHSFSENDRVGACFQVLHTLVYHCLCKNGSCCSSVSGYIVCLGSDFSDKLCAHVLESVFKLDLFRDRNTVVCDQRCAEGFVKDNVSSFRSKCNFYCISELVHTFLKCCPGFCSVFDFLCHVNPSPYFCLIYLLCYDREDIALFYDDILFAVQLHICS